MRRIVAGPGESVDLSPLVSGHLGNDVGRRTEAVDPQPPGVAGQRQRPVADQARAQERGGLGVSVGGRDREAVTLVCHHVLGITAVARVAGETGPVTEVLATLKAVPAGPASSAEPRDANPVSLVKSVNALAFLEHDANDLVAGHQRQFRIGQFPICTFRDFMSQSSANS